MCAPSDHSQIVYLGLLTSRCLRCERISSNLKGNTKQFGWLQATATKASSPSITSANPATVRIDNPPSGKGIDKLEGLRVLLKAVLTPDVT